MNNRFNIRPAQPNEAGLVLEFIKKLAVYEKCADVERNCGRMEWICLDWNQSALKVYSSIEAIPMDEWTVQRLNEKTLKQFALE